MTTPDALIVISMEYVSHTWRLPKSGAPNVLKNRTNREKVCVPNSLITQNSFSTLGTDFEVCVPDSLNTQNSFSALGDKFDNGEEAYVPDFLR